MSGALYIINPNSSQAVTDGIDAALDPLRAMGREIVCVTLTDGPPGIAIILDRIESDLEANGE